MLPAGEEVTHLQNMEGGGEKEEEGGAWRRRRNVERKSERDTAGMEREEVEEKE